MQWDDDCVHNPSLAAVPMACAPTATHAAHGVRTSRDPNAEVPVGHFSKSFLFQLVIVQAQFWQKLHYVPTPLTRLKRVNLKIGHEDALARGIEFCVLAYKMLSFVRS